MKRFHYCAGWFLVVAFVLTGQYMDRVHGHLRGFDDATRLLFRSRHIYILGIGLVHLMLGTYLVPQSAGWRKSLQIIGSVLLTVAGVALLAGFFYETAHFSLEGAPVRYGLFAMLGGAVLHALSNFQVAGSRQ